MQPNITLNVTITTPEAALALLNSLGIAPAFAQQVPAPMQFAPTTQPVTPPAAPISNAGQPPATQPGVTSTAAAAMAAMQPVPTAAPAYALPDLHKAASSLVDAGKREALVALLGGFGVQAVTQLPPAQYGAFATELRKMGAAI